MLHAGATKTLVLYAHYDGQPVDASKWTTPPWSPVLRTKEVQLGGITIPIPATSTRFSPHTPHNSLLAERIKMPAFNVRGIRAGGVRETGSNTIATEAFASIDLRLVPGQKPARVRQLVEAHMRAQGYFVTNDSVTVAMRLAHPKVARVEWGGGYPGSRAPMDGPFGRAVIAALSDGAKDKRILNPTVGASRPSYLFEQILKVPIISLPIANYDDNQHAADENLRVQNLWDGIELYTALLTGIGKVWRGPVP